MLVAKKKLIRQTAIDAILVTMTPTAGFTVGFNLTFTGSIDIDFKDGGGKEALTSGVEKTHTYSSAGTYIADITGDLENITAFIANDNRITTISNFKTGLLTVLDLSNNLINGVFDLSLAPISNVFIFDTNPSLTGFTFASSGNGLLTIFRVYSTGIIGNIDLSNVPISGSLEFQSCPSLTGFTFASTGNGLLTRVRGYSCNITGILDFSNVPVSGEFSVYSNTSLTGFTFASSGNAATTTFNVRNNNLTGILDLSNVPLGDGSKLVDGNSLLINVLFSPTGNGTITLFRANSCALQNLDFTVFSTSGASDIELANNSMTATEVDNQIINCDNTGWINGQLAIALGNAARTSASDIAYNNMIAKGWTIT